MDGARRTRSPPWSGRVLEEAVRSLRARHCSKEQTGRLVLQSVKNFRRALVNEVDSPGRAIGKGAPELMMAVKDSCLVVVLQGGECQNLHEYLRRCWSAGNEQRSESRRSFIILQTRSGESYWQTVVLYVAAVQSPLFACMSL